MRHFGFDLLGSVTEVESVPSGDTDIFLGTVTVVSSAPSCVPNLYLGRIKSGSPSGSQNNPSLGQVLIVAIAPANDTDPFLGTVTETS